MVFQSSVLFILLSVTVSSLQLSVGRDDHGVLPTLHVVNPSHAGHLGLWSNLVASILTANQSIDDNLCLYGRTTMTTIVSDEHERAVFEKRLAEVQSSCGLDYYGWRPIDMFKIRTLEEVLQSTKTLAETDMADVTPSNKYVYQAVKKFYGCLDAAGVSMNHLPPLTKDVCFLVDSDSRLLRNSFCHLASVYSRNKTVFTSPNPDPVLHVPYDAVAYSRKVLGHSPRPREGDDTFGEFYAMESYHWIFEVQHVWNFLQKASLASYAVAWTRTPAMLMLDEPMKPDVETPYVFPEEAIYHFLYPNRVALGYNFVNANEILKGVVGDNTYNDMIQVKPRRVFQLLFRRLQALSLEQVSAIGRAFRHYGVLQMRCGHIEEENVQALMLHMDLCGSGYSDGPPDDEISEPPTCLSQ